MKISQPAQTLLGLDIGQKRIGVARASSLARLPEPVTIIPADGQQFSTLQALVDQYSPAVIVVGVPKNLDGEETQQSATIRSWLADFKKQIKTTAKIEVSDESLSTRLARRRAPTKRHVDDLAACFILDDFLGNPIVV